MKFKLVINTAGKAFQGGERGKAAELAWILTQLSRRMDERGEVFSGPIFDSNGNAVGSGALVRGDREPPNN